MEYATANLVSLENPVRKKIASTIVPTMAYVKAEINAIAS